MLVGVLPEGRNSEQNYSTKQYIKLLIHNNINYILLNINEPDFWSKVKTCDFFIFRWTHHDYSRQIAKNILPIIEKHLGIKCFPSSNCSWVYDDKIREYTLLSLNDFPFAKCWVFYDKKKALSFVEEALYPMVFKLTHGAGAQTVKLVKNKKEAKKMTNLMFGKGLSNNIGLPGSLKSSVKEKGIIQILRKEGGKIKNRLREGRFYFNDDWKINKNYILFQKFLPGNSYDTRVVVIGERAFAFQRMNRPDDFRASGSNNFVIDPEKIDINFIKVAFDVSFKMNFESMAYDFIYDKNKKPSIIEISYAFGSKYGSKVSECPGFWDKCLNWNQGHFTPEYLQLKDFLKLPDIKMIS